MTNKWYLISPLRKEKRNWIMEERLKIADSARGNVQWAEVEIEAGDYEYERAKKELLDIVKRNPPLEYLIGKYALAGKEVKIDETD